jgi:hypothetical protein
LGIDVAVADFVDLQHFSVLPHHGHGAGEQTGVAGVANGALVAVEIHPSQVSQWRRARTYQVRRWQR